MTRSILIPGRRIVGMGVLAVLSIEVFFVKLLMEVLVAKLVQC